MLRRKIFYIIGLLFFVFLFSHQAKAFIHSSDTISNSAPGAKSNHLIQFQTVHNIPAGGKIVISPQASAFTIPSGLNWRDFDLATSSDGISFFERNLNATSSVLFDGVSSVLSTTTNANLEINLNSSFGIDAGDYVRIKIGTNANYNGSGDSQIINPSNIGAYDFAISAYDNLGNYLERAPIKIYIIRQVKMTENTEKRRSDAAPSGWLTYGTTQTIMSLYTNYRAHCRYSTASGTPYDLMTDEFSYVGTSTSHYHTVTLSGLANGHSYQYYVRCEDEHGNKDDETICSYSSASTTPYHDASGTPILSLRCTDYLISFSVSSVEGGVDDGTGAGSDESEGESSTSTDSTSNESGDGGGSGDRSGSGSRSGGAGGSGGGGGGGIGFDSGQGTGDYLPYPPPPGAPGVVLEGWGYPGREIIVLKDGVEQGKILADNSAKFGGFVEDLSQGIYTFGLWSIDADGRRSITYSTTFWIDDGTQSTVSDIFLPPTIELGKESITAGEELGVFGQTVPDATVEVWFYPKKDSELREEEIKKTTTKARSDGRWYTTVDTTDAVNGEYHVKAKAHLESVGASRPVGNSDFSQVLECSVGGQKPKKKLCANADLNGDGRVNITDFSILLYYWNTDNACADQNGDGSVNLIDFSIMMYYWTG